MNCHLFEPFSDRIYESILLKLKSHIVIKHGFWSAFKIELKIMSEFMFNFESTMESKLESRSDSKLKSELKGKFKSN